MVRVVPPGNDTQARFARPYSMLPHFLVFMIFSTSAIGAAHRYMTKGQSGRRLTVVEKVLCTNHLNRTGCFRDDCAGNGSKDHAPHTAVTMRTQYD